MFSGRAKDAGYPGAVAEIRAAVTEQRECVVEILNDCKDQTTFWNRLSITPVRDPAGAVTHCIGVQSDVTARREAEGALRRSKEALEQDLRLAARIQQTLLPPPDMRIRALGVAHAFRPCTDLAGDAVGIVPLPREQVGPEDGSLPLSSTRTASRGTGGLLPGRSGPFVWVAR